MRSIPSYRLHKPTGQAVVRLGGCDIYVGKHDTEASREKYRRVVAEWLSSGSHPPARPAMVEVPSAKPTVNELILVFWRHAEAYYRQPDGTPTGEPTKIKLAVKPLKNLYGMTLAEDSGPNSLKTLRDSMVDGGLFRRTANQRIAHEANSVCGAISNMT